MNKIISFCLSGRNDNYGSDFAAKLSLSVNYLARNAVTIGAADIIEVVITDWNSPSPLYKELYLTDEAAKMVKFIAVPPKVAGKFNPPGSDFHMTLPTNVGLRRGTGKYLAFMPSDILIPEFQLRQLLDVLGGKYNSFFDAVRTCFYVSRKFLPSDFNIQNDIMNFRKLDDFIIQNDSLLNTGNSSKYLLSGAGVLIFHRDTCFNLRGLNEKHSGWGYSDIEFGLRLPADVDILNMSFFGVCVYDFEPNKNSLNIKINRSNKFSVLKVDVNSSEWGLSNLDLAVTQYPSSSYKQYIPRHDTANYAKNNFKELFISADNSMKLFSIAYHKLPAIEPYFYPLCLCVKKKGMCNIIDYGSTSDLFPVMISSISPCSNFLMILPNDDGEHDILKNVLKIDSYMGKLNHKGDLRFIPDKLLLSYIDSSILRHGFDIFTLNVDFKEDFNLNVIDTVLKHLSDSGCVILHGNNKENMIQVRNIVSNVGRHMIFADDKLNITIMVKSETQNEVFPIPSAKYWRRRRPNKIVLYSTYFCNLIFKQLLELIYMPKTMWPGVIISFIRDAKKNIVSKVDF